MDIMFNKFEIDINNNEILKTKWEYHKEKKKAEHHW
jgi:hypothetical protein